jgi:hypothetical protein
MPFGSANKASAAPPLIARVTCSPAFQPDETETKAAVISGAAISGATLIWIPVGPTLALLPARDGRRLILLGPRTRSASRSSPPRASTVGGTVFPSVNGRGASRRPANITGNTLCARTGAASVMYCQTQNIAFAENTATKRYRDQDIDLLSILQECPIDLPGRTCTFLPPGVLLEPFTVDSYRAKSYISFCPFPLADEHNRIPHAYP